MIYLDNNATTPLDPLVVEAMLPFLREHFANPSSGYDAAKPVRRALTTAREQAAALLDVTPEEIVFTSGGTEADNAAIHSAVQAFPERKHLITCATEHDAVLSYCAWLERTQGFEITRLGVSAEGAINLDELSAALRPGVNDERSVGWRPRCGGPAMDRRALQRVAMCRKALRPDRSPSSDAASARL